MSAARLAIGAAAAALLAAPVVAHSYRVEIAAPAGGKLLKGHAGVEAADDRTATALVRVIAPGNEVKQLGTIRVLVKNLGTTPFEFGPDNVRLSLGDGTVMAPVPVAQMERGRTVVEREYQHAAAIDHMNGNNLSGLDGQAVGGTSAQSMSPRSVTSGSSSPATAGQDQRTDDSLLPGAQLLGYIDQLLVPLTVEPQQAWGGYYVFEVPRPAYEKRADQALTIVIRTGVQEHRFPATLKWK